MNGKIVKVSGPLIVADNMANVKLFDVVKVGSKGLIGEIIELRGARASVQVYEETSGLGPGDDCISTGAPLSVELGPGIIGGIYDGIQRPLDLLRQKSGDRIEGGITAPSLDRDKKWNFVPTAKKGDHVKAGDIIGTVAETKIVEHKIMVPFGAAGTITEIKSGEAAITDTVAKLKTDDGKTINLTMMQKWPVRKGRPYKEKLSPKLPMITGQRIIDTLFPIARGGAATIPGPFGSGKTVFQHQLAKWADAEIVVYVGCGERGNEMTDVLTDFPTLKDPKTGEALMKRTILIANTSDMPVAAREASIYTGITIAEYFRDMGYNVAIMADSTSRWAEALREMSGRLEEMPGEEGYPAYLSSRLADFYERAGIVKTLGSNSRTGSITAIGAVSPPGGDLAEPVAQGTLRIVKVFWGLSANLAYRRHFPAIDWNISYSLYADGLTDWFNNNVSNEFSKYRSQAIGLLSEEAVLEEMVRLVGMDSLSSKDRLVLETAKMLREDFLHQDAFSDVDNYASLKKQFKILKLIIDYYELGLAAIDRDIDINKILYIKTAENIGRAKHVPESELTKLDLIGRELINEMEALSGEDD